MCGYDYHTIVDELKKAWQDALDLVPDVDNTSENDTDSDNDVHVW